MHPLQAAWCDLMIDIPFQDFGTYTFDRLRRLHPEAVHKKVRLHISRANDILFGRQWRRHQPGIGSLIALEPHKDDRIHVHCLHYHPEVHKADPHRRVLLKNLWEAGAYAHPESLCEGISRVLPAADNAAKAYCAKAYATKGGDLWIDDALHHYMLGRPWQRSLPCSS
jgi:hypothetical protein